mmetsp:Transcript_36527/g.65355  ORF Transcript_36527/g.65355 Transcript_36527/m.65355 type:complete len:228 (+) Transcript_36527:713-1396(+)
MSVQPLDELLHDGEQAGSLFQRTLVRHKHPLTADDLAALNFLEVVLLQGGSGGDQVENDVRAAHGRRGLQGAVCRYEREVLKASIVEETLRDVHVTSHNPEGVVTGELAGGLEVLQAVDLGAPSIHGDTERKVAVAKTQLLMDDNEVIVVPRNLSKHVVSDDPEVDVSIHKLADHITRALEPDLHIGDLSNLRDVLPGVDLLHVQLAALEQVDGVLCHAPLGRESNP